MIRFSPRYCILFITLLITEILIGAYMHDDLIRPYGGDFLVVILLYCMVKTILRTPVIPTAIAVLLFSYLIEWTQYLHLADHLGLKPHSLARIIIGDYFTWTDIYSYTLGIAAVILIEKIPNVFLKFRQNLHEKDPLYPRRVYILPWLRPNDAD